MLHRLFRTLKAHIIAVTSLNLTVLTTHHACTFRRTSHAFSKLEVQYKELNIGNFIDYLTRNLKIMSQLWMTATFVPLVATYGGKLLFFQIWPNWSKYYCSMLTYKIAWWA